MVIRGLARSAAMASTSWLSSRISSARKAAGSSSASASTRKPLLSKKPHSALPVWGQPRRCNTASTPLRNWTRGSMADRLILVGLRHAHQGAPVRQDGVRTPPR